MNSFEESKKYFLEGIELYSKGKYEEAVTKFIKSLDLEPDRPSILLNLSKTYYKLDDHVKAEEKLEKIFSLVGFEDEKKEAFRLILEIYTKQNNVEKILFNKKRITANNLGNKLNYLKHSLFYPSFFNSKEEIDIARDNIIENIDNLLNSKDCPKLDLENEMLDPINFRLTYDGKPNLDIYKKLVKLYRKIYQVSDEHNLYADKSRKKIKLAFISEFFTNHTISKWFRGVIYKLDKQKFEVIVFHSDKTKKGNRFEEIKRNELIFKYENIFLPESFFEKKKLIEDKNLDILFYTDIHMSTNLYFLTLYKLARYQITTLGHPETTGNNKIDYFLSSKLLETDNYEKRYTEKVILSESLPMYFYKPEIKLKLNRNDLTKKNIYSCPQAIFKMHPSFDIAIKKILHKDKKAQIYFVKDKSEFLYKQFIKRLKKSISSDFDRIKFIKPNNVEEFINHCGRASVLLDPFIFGSATSFIESMFYGTPTISMPNESMKSRIVDGAYKQMQITDAPIKTNLDDYVDHAIEIANNDNYDLKKFFSDQADKFLYDNDNFIEEFENLILKIIN